MRALSIQERFKLNLITKFIAWNSKDEISDEVRSLLLRNALNFVENEGSGFEILTDEDVENLKVMYNHVDEDSDLAKSMLKVLEFVRDIPTNPNEGLVTWDYTDNPKKIVTIRKAITTDKVEHCHPNVIELIQMLGLIGVVGFNVEDDLKWK